MAGVAAAVAAGVGAAAAVAGTAYSIKAGEDASDRADNANEDAKNARKAAIREFDTLDVPALNERLVQLERLKSVGDLTPDMEKAITEEETRLKQIKVDPSFRQAQKETLSKLEDIGNNDGLSPIEQAQLEKINSTMDTENRANQGAILQGAAQRGSLSGGAVTNAQLLAQQMGANRAHEQGTAVASDAYKRAMQAIEDRGELAGKLEGQDYAEQADAAKAQDAINSFNVRQRTDVQRANTDRANMAQQINLNNNQRISDTNTSLQWQEEQRRANAVREKYEDELRKKAGKTSQLAGYAGQQSAAGANAEAGAAAAASGIASGAAKIGGTLVDYGLKNWGSSTAAPAATVTSTNSFQPSGFENIG